MGWVSASSPWIVQGSAVLHILYSCLLASILEVETSFLNVTIICLEVIYMFFKEFTLDCDHYGMSRYMSLYLLCLGFCGSFVSMVSFSSSAKSSAIISSTLSQLHPHSSPLGPQWNVWWAFLLYSPCCKSTHLCFPYFCFSMLHSGQFLWSNLWFLIMSSVVFNLLPNITAEILMLLNFPFLKVLFDSPPDLLVHLVVFFPADVWKLVVYFFHVVSISELKNPYLKSVQACYCSPSFVLVLTHLLYFPMCMIFFSLFCWLLPLKNYLWRWPKAWNKCAFPLWVL